MCIQVMHLLLDFVFLCPGVFLRPPTKQASGNCFSLISLRRAGYRNEIVSFCILRFRVVGKLNKFIFFSGS